MSVNRITNKQVVSKESVNRAEQISTKNSTQRQGNREASVTPGIDYTKNYAITLKDVDSSILNHCKNGLKPKIKSIWINFPNNYAENLEKIILKVLYKL